MLENKIVWVFVAVIAALILFTSWPAGEEETVQPEFDTSDFIDHKPEAPPVIKQPEFKPSPDLDRAIDRWNK